jgi:type I restriction-modification system DNA methylase subunit
LTEFSANNIDARLQFLLEQRDRLINSGASPQGVWLSVGQVYKKDFRQVVWKSAKKHGWLGGNKSRYIGKENSDEHKSAIAQHKAGQELRKVEREIKAIQKKLEKS